MSIIHRDIVDREGTIVLMNHSRTIHLHCYAILHPCDAILHPCDGGLGVSGCVSFARTSLFRSVGFFLNAMSGFSGKIFLSSGSACISVHVWFSVFLISGILSLYFTAKIGFPVCVHLGFWHSSSLLCSKWMFEVCSEIVSVL